MSTKVRVKKIVQKPRNDKPGLIDIELIDDTYYVEMTVEVSEEVPDEESVIDVDLELYATSEYDLFKDADDFYKQKEGSMADQSIISIGSFVIDSNGFKKSPEIFLNGSVLDVHEYDDCYEAKIECLHATYYAILDKYKGKKPKVGNVISSMFWVEMSIRKDFVCT